MLVTSLWTQVLGTIKREEQVSGRRKITLSSQYPRKVILYEGSGVLQTFIFVLSPLPISSWVSCSPQTLVSSSYVSGDNSYIYFLGVLWRKMRWCMASASHCWRKVLKCMLITHPSHVPKRPLGGAGEPLGKNSAPSEQGMGQKFLNFVLTCHH